MAGYDGGAHSGELIATDGAGKKATKAWTINVSPQGSVPAGEAFATLDAADVTSDATIVASTEEAVDPAEQESGYNPGLNQAAAQLESTGTAADSTIAVDPSDGFTIESSDGMVHAEPVSVGEAATPMTVSEDVAAISANSANNVDTVVRPVFTGVFDYRSIRDASAPQTYSWDVQLESDQVLRQVTPEYVAVEYSDGHLAFGITATPAHDSVGTTIGTTLSVDGNVLTMTIPHQNQGFVYPIVGGVGWEGGFTTEVISMPPPEIPEEEIEESLTPGSIQMNVGPPEPIEPNDPDGATASGFKLQKRFGFITCSFISCGLWEVRLRGFFYYNFYKAWYPKERDPGCPTNNVPTYDIDIEKCEWVGPNHQPYGDGYHITAQGFFDISGGWFTKNIDITARAFGSGGVYPHGNDRICNPSRPECA